MQGAGCPESRPRRLGCLGTHKPLPVLQQLSRSTPCQVLACPELKVGDIQRDPEKSRGGLMT